MVQSMIPIEYKGNINPKAGTKPSTYAEYLEKYHKALMPTRYSIDVERLNDWCRANISLEKETAGNEWEFKDVVCASPTNIIKIKELIDGLSKENRKSLVDISDYVVRVLYSRRMRDGKAREILEESAKVRVCPYCNRNLTKQIDIKGRFKTTCELDHFFPKGGSKDMDYKGYSLLATSFFNLIPVCHFCNMTKRNNELKAFYPYVYDWDEANKIRITYYPLKCDYIDLPESLDVAIRIDAPNSDSGKDNPFYGHLSRKEFLHDISILHLSDIYQNNRYEVQKILKKNLVYEDKYSEMIYDGFRKHFSSVQEVSDLMLDRVRELHDIANVPLGKLMHDIGEEISAN